MHRCQCHSSSTCPCGMQRRELLERPDVGRGQIADEYLSHGSNPWPLCQRVPLVRLLAPCSNAYSSARAEVPLSPLGKGTPSHPPSLRVGIPA